MLLQDRVLALQQVSSGFYQDLEPCEKVSGAQMHYIYFFKREAINNTKLGDIIKNYPTFSSMKSS